MMWIAQERLRGVAAMAGLANDTTVEPRRRQCRARGAKRLASAPCAVRKPGQDEWCDRQGPGTAPDQQAQPPSVSGFSREIRALVLEALLSIRWAITHGDSAVDPRDRSERQRNWQRDTMNNGESSTTIQAGTQ